MLFKNLLNFSLFIADRHLQLVLPIMVIFWQELLKYSLFIYNILQKIFYNFKTV